MRAVAAFVLALGVSAPAVLASSPAFASGCSASVSDPYPAHNQTVTVSFTGPAGAAARVVAHYHTVDDKSSATTDSAGRGHVGFNIGTAPYGETVVVDVVIGSAGCSTSFEPRAAGATTTAAPKSTTAAVLTGVNGGSTTTTDPPVVRTAASAAGSALAFTGNATWVEAGAGVLLVGLGSSFPGSARRRQELVRRLWPDER